MTPTLARLACLAVLVAPGLILAADPVPAAAAPSAAVPTYAKDVAPIFRRSCESCHRPGEIAPMSLLTYEDTRPWLRSIKKEVVSRAMPPWHADPKHGEFANDPTLSKDEVDTITRWIDGDAPEGDPKELPPAREWVEGWRIGTPDIVFTLPEDVDVPANGVVPYRYFTVPTGFTEDRWIVAADARPGNREVVHHIIVFVLDPNRRRRGLDLNSEITGYAPGEGPTVLRPGAAKRIPAGASLLFQMHYTPTGTAATDRSKVGLVFAKEPVKEAVYTRTVINQKFRIPRGAPNHPVEASRSIRRDALLHGLMPHMHLRGKSWEFRLVEPDGAERVLLSVPEYDFDWQHYYMLKEPLLIKAGSTVRAVAHYDNSKDNPANPNPDEIVGWGDQTWEEMMIGFLTLSEPIPDAASAGEKVGEF